MSLIMRCTPLCLLLLVSSSWAEELPSSSDQPATTEAPKAVTPPPTLEAPVTSAVTTPVTSAVTTPVTSAVTPPVTSAVTPAPRKGFSVAVGASLATCLPSGAADCSNTFPGASISGALEKRFWYLGVALEMDYGFHIVTGSGSEDVSSTTTHVTPMLKGYYPLQSWELFFGAGLGYSAIKVSEDSSDSSASWSTLWRGVKLSAGAWYDLHPHGLPKGFTLDLAAQLLINSGGARCTEYAGSESCLSVDELTPAQRDAASHLQLNTALRYTF